MWLQYHRKSLLASRNYDFWGLSCMGAISLQGRDEQSIRTGQDKVSM